MWKTSVICKLIFFSEKCKGEEKGGLPLLLISLVLRPLLESGLKDLALAQLRTHAPCYPHSRLSLGPRPPWLGSWQWQAGPKQPQRGPLLTASPVNGRSWQASHDPPASVAGGLQPQNSRREHHSQAGALGASRLQGQHRRAQPCLTSRCVLAGRTGRVSSTVASNVRRARPTS